MHKLVWTATLEVGPTVALTCLVTGSKFDRFAADYQRLVAESIAASGESPDYFQRYKVECLGRRRLLGRGPILDVGCGIGSLTRHLVTRGRDVHGYDPSEKCLDEARRAAPSATFHGSLDTVADQRFGLAVLSGVLHHVPVEERLELIKSVRTKLRPGGIVAIFEHNPFNPLTRKAVRDCSFDEDAMLLWPWQASALLTQSGLVEPRLDYIVFFPRPLGFVRPLEPRLHWLPMGAQYLATGLE